jgi:hypothetical protein
VPFQFNLRRYNKAASGMKDFSEKAADGTRKLMK